MMDDGRSVASPEGRGQSLTSERCSHDDDDDDDVHSVVKTQTTFTDGGEAPLQIHSDLLTVHLLSTQL